MNLKVSTERAARLAGILLFVLAGIVALISVSAIALPNCFREDWGGSSGKAKRILLPVRHLQHWIEHNVLLLLKQAPFNKRDTQLVPSAGSCVDCPKRTGNNKLLFVEWAEIESQCKLCGIRAIASVFRWLAAVALPA